MTAKRDYYEVLGVSKTTPINEIKSQYRKLALKFHPDRNKSKDAGEHFKEISEAYAVISDPEKRSIYDQHGHAGVNGRYSSDDIFQGASANFSDIFGSSGEGNNVHDITCPGKKHQQSFKPEAETAVRNAAEPPGVKIPPVIFCGDAHLLHSRLKHIKPFLTLASANNLADAGEEYIHATDGLSVIVLLHVK